jgi:site-specific DNA-cytosine methylase
MKSLKLLEFFAGSRSVGKAAKKLKYEVFSTDIENFRGVDYVVDILEFDYSKVPFVPDIIWMSPPCTAFSVSGVSYHFRDDKPISKEAKLGIKLLKKSLEIIEYYLKLNPKLIFHIENPRGMMRKMPQLAKYKRVTVTYCQYGDKRMKPTDIWTNNTKFVPKMCENGAPCHVAAPRGSKTGTQGMKNAYERGKIPQKLCTDILKSCQ